MKGLEILRVVYVSVNLTIDGSLFFVSSTQICETFHLLSKVLSFGLKAIVTHFKHKKRVGFGFFISNTLRCIV